MTEFRMPSLGADMEAGTLVEWKIRPGDTVRRGDIVATVETQKGLVEVEIWEPGVVEALLVQPGVKVPVGTVLATLRSREAAPAEAPPVERPRASPVARQRARDLGVDLASVQGTGPHGAITLEDIERWAKAKEPTKEPVAEAPKETPKSVSSSAMRQAIASAMSRSKREIPHYYLGADIDVQRAVEWLESQNASRTVNERVLFAAVLLKATALAVREIPEVNGFFVNGAFVPSKQIHLGVAISLKQGGLVAPAIHDVDEKPVVRVMADLRDVVARARAGTLRASEMSDPTLTVTNLGDQGVTSVFGVIYPPQVALVGFGKPTERPWAENGMLGVRKVLVASLAADHRVTDGHRGGLFLAALTRILSEPEKL